MMVISPHLLLTSICIAIFIVIFALQFPFTISIPHQKHKKTQQCIQAGSVKACKLPDTNRNTFEQGHNNNHYHIHQPSSKTKVYKITTSRQSETLRAGFQVVIIGNSTFAQRRSIDLCMEKASIWWPSNIRVDVLVNFSTVGGPRVLGSARPTSNWEIDGIIYPVALAEALTNTTLNQSPSNSSTGEISDHYDVYMTLNSAAKWFTSFDQRAVPEAMSYDLQTVCLHEVIHGLFMTGGNLVVNQQTGSGNYIATLFNPRFIGRFDAFMANENGCSVIVGYSNNSQYLGSALTGNNLWFADYNGNKIARLHAPKPYIVGSSLYHLSEATYGVDVSSNNDLMTPVIGTSYTQHEIGEVVKKMLDIVFDMNQGHAKNCNNIGPPVDDDSIIEGGGASNNGDGSGNGGGAEGTDDQNQSGFFISLGTMRISGWIIVGAAIGIVLTIFSGAFIVRSIIVSSTKRRMPARMVPRQDRVEMVSNGNTTGMI